MYLTEPRLFDVVKKQLHYKFNGYTGVFTSLLIMQVIGILLGIGNESGYSSLGESFAITWKTSSNDNVVVFSLLWAFITGILVTTTAYRNDAFTFVSNRFSHHLSSFLFLLIASAFAGFTAALAGSLIKFITLFKNEEVFIETSGLLNSPMDFFLRIGTSIAYILLYAGLGYTVGSFVQRSKLVVPLIFVGLFALPFVVFFTLGIEGDQTNGSFLERLISFYGAERHFSLFLVKVVGTMIVFFILSALALNKKEVRR